MNDPRKAERRLASLTPGQRFVFAVAKTVLIGRPTFGFRGVVLGPGLEGGIAVRVQRSTTGPELEDEWSGYTYVTPEDDAAEGRAA
jgi:hypothetical protein